MAQDTLFGTRPAFAITNIRARAGRDPRSAADGRKLALIVEGGAMRGVFSCGGGIALEALGLTRAFDEVYACSSGAINAAYFLAGQAAYSVSIYYNEVNNRQFINPLRIKNILSMDFLFDEVIKRRKPLDVERVLASPTNLRISITDARTGAGFLVDSRDDRYALLDSLRASATHPLLSERSIRLGDRDCFDGGFANPLPIKEALEAGCHRRIAVTHADARLCRSAAGIFAAGIVSMALCARQRDAGRGRARHPCPREPIARSCAWPARAATRRKYRCNLSRRRHAPDADNDKQGVAQGRGRRRRTPGATGLRC